MQALRKQLRKTTRTRKGRIIISSILLVILAAIAGGVWYWNTHKKSIIRNEIVKAIDKKSQGLYKISYENLDLNVIAGSLSISNLDLVFDSTQFDSLEKQEKAPPVLFNVHIPRINITGVKTPKALLDNEIVGRKLELLNPVIDIQYTYSGKDAERNIPTKEVYEQILGNLNLIHIDSVSITGAQVTTSNGKTGKKIVQMENVSLVLVDIKVDSAANADSSRYFFSREFSLECSKVVWHSANKLYHYTAQGIALSSISRDVLIQGFRMDPTLGEEAFVKALPTQDDRFDFVINNIQLRNIDLSQMFEENIIAENMLIRSASFKVYRDLAIPRDKKNRVGRYPHQVLDDIPLPFQITTVTVSNASVEYKERNHITRQAGKVQFNNINATISNFTNEKKAIAKNNIMTANVNSRFLNKTHLKTNWIFYINHPKGRFDLKGEVGPIDATEINPLTIPMGPARIKEGKINGLVFDLKGHDYGMDGSVKMLYEDLKVAMLEKDKGSTTLDKKSLLSFIANIVIKNSNPKGDEDVRVAQAHFDRDTNRSIFHLCWKTLFKGIRETIGIKK